MDPRLQDPEHGDYRVAPGSPACDYGCRTFAPPASASGPEEGADPVSAPDAAAMARTQSGRLRAGVAGGIIDADTVWDADTVRVAGDLFVADGTTLAIEPGVTVLFEGWYSIFVRGRLLAVGTPSSPIRFDSAQADLWASDSSLFGAWSGLRFDGTRAANGVSRLEWCRISHTKGLAGRDRGGAISMIGCSNLQVRNSVFFDNAAQYGGVLYCERMANPILCGNLIAENFAYTGGSAVYCVDSYPRLFENTIARNTCLNPDGSYATGVVHNHMGKAWLSGCIVYGNTSHYFLPSQMREPKAFCVRYCDVQNGIDGEGDFDADPLFRGWGEHPFALDGASPCRDAGPADTTGQDLGALDLAGLERVTGGLIDVGAYEWIDPAWADDSGLPRRGDDAAGLRLTAAPNPGSASRGSIELTLDSVIGSAECAVFDANGRRLRLLHTGPLPSGTLRLAWDGTTDRGRKVPAGTYWIEAGDGTRHGRCRVVLID